MKTDLNDLLKLIIQDKGGTSQQYNQLMNQIAYHETGAHQRMNPRAMQEEGGPGRGLFMFEEGNNMGGNTAVNRTHAYLKSSGVAIPQWLNDIWEGTKSVDASKLSAEKQKMLFLGNYMGHPEANFADVISGGMNTKEFWANYHWAGKEDDEETRMKSFDESLADIRKKNDNQIAPFVHTPLPMTYTKQKEEFDPTTIWDNIFGKNKSSIVDEIEKGYKFAATGGKGSEAHRKSLDTDFGKGWEYAITGGNPGKFVDGEYQEGSKESFLSKLLSGFKNMGKE